MPLISGDDLIALGYRPGPIFKEILKAVEDAQLDLVIHDRAQALNWVESHFERKATSSGGACNIVGGGKRNLVVTRIG